MTIKELCEVYGCNRTGIYQKLKRNEEALKDHVTYKVGAFRKKILILDDYAVDYLIPDKYKNQEKYSDELSELKTSLRNEKMFRNSAELKSDELSNRISELESKLKNLEAVESENTDLQKKINELLEKLTELEKENSELKKNQKKRFF